MGQSETAASNPDDLKYILIRRGISLTDIENIDNGQTLESQIARGRGGGKLTSPPTGHNHEAPGENAGTVTFDEGMLSSETDFFMHFLSHPSHRVLPPMDVASMPQNIAYPVNQTTLNSLPNWALSKLYGQGHIKIKAEYRGSLFKDVHEGWNKATNPYDRILQMADQFEGDIIQVVYYLAAENASGKWSDPKTMADLRDIQTESVENAIARIDRMLTNSDKLA